MYISEAVYLKAKISHSKGPLIILCLFVCRALWVTWPVGSLHWFTGIWRGLMCRKKALKVGSFKWWNTVTFLDF